MVLTTPNRCSKVSASYTYTYTYAYAQYNLGVMYANGQGVLQDNVYAHMWFNIAASSGDEVASKNRDIVAKKMNSTDISAAQKLARECIRKNYKGC